MKTREEILTDTMELLEMLCENLDFEGEINENTLIIDELGFESLDAVVLANTMQEKYSQKLPFTEFFAEIGEREKSDISVEEWVDFIYNNLQDKA